MGTLRLAVGAARRLPPGRTTERVGRVLAALTTRLGADAVVPVPMRDGTVLELDARSRTESAPFWSGRYETEYTAALIALAGGQGSCVHDCGANVGLIAVPLARALESSNGTVICFEPVPENVSRLTANIRRNGLTNCTVHPVALGAAEGRVTFARESGQGAATGNAILLDGRHDPDHLPRGYRAHRSAPIARLDDLVAAGSVPLPHVVKLDLEGSEVGYLVGARDTLRRARPIILGEFNSTLMPQFGTTFLDAARELPDEYAVLSFAGDDRLREVAPRVGLGDVLLVPRERLNRLTPLWTVELL